MPLHPTDRPSRQLVFPFIEAAVRQEVEEPRVEGTSFAGWLSDRMGFPVRVVLTENRWTLFSFRRWSQGGVLRADRSFLGAPEDVLESLALFLEGDRQSARPVLKAFGQVQMERPHRPVKPLARGALRERGRCFHLGEILGSLNRRFFAETLDVCASWGRRTPRIGRNLRLGSYDLERRVIRVHPVLDHPEVPTYVVEGVVYHEMVHAAVGPGQANGRRVLHGAEFRQRERLFPQGEAAKAWLKEEFPRLLARHRRPLGSKPAVTAKE